MTPSHHSTEDTFSLGVLPSGNTSMGFPDGANGKESACNARDMSLIPGSKIFPGEGNGHPLQYSCMENPMDRRGWQAIVHEVTKSRTQLSD